MCQLRDLTVLVIATCGTHLTKQERQEVDNQKRITLLRGNKSPPLCDVVPFEINNENYILLYRFILIGFICSIFHNFSCNSVDCRLG